MIESLLLRNLTWINGVARAFCHNRMDAEDLAGDTILKILLYSGNYDTRKSFRLWAFVIMRNILRNKRRHLGIVETYWNIPETSEYEDMDLHSIARDCVSLIEKCAESNVCIKYALLYAKGHSYNDMAQMFDVTIGIVKTRIHRGRKAILRQITR